MSKIVFEAKYLLSLLGVIFRQDYSYPLQKKPDWEKLYRLADYHDTSSAVHLAMMGNVQGIPEKWRERFHTRYQESLEYTRIFEGAETEVLSSLNEQKLSAVILSSSAIRKLYPIPETAANSPLVLYFGESSYSIGRGYLIDLGYETNVFYEGFGEHMRRADGLEIDIYHTLPYLAKTYKKNILSFLESSHSDERYPNLRSFSPEGFFLYRMLDSCYHYCTDSLKIRELLDLYFFYVHYHEQMDLEYVSSKCEDFSISELSENLMHIAEMWVGKKGSNLFSENRNDVSIYDALENRILTNGKSELDTLPDASLIRKEIQVELNKLDKEEQKKLRKEKIRNFFINIKKTIRWIFPDYKYMASLHPFLEKLPILLPIFWIFRGLNMLKIEIKLFFSNMGKKKEQPEDDVILDDSLSAERSYRTSSGGRRERKKTAWKPKQVDGKPVASYEFVGQKGKSVIISGANMPVANQETAGGDLNANAAFLSGNAANPSGDASMPSSFSSEGPSSATPASAFGTASMPSSIGVQGINRANRPEENRNNVNGAGGLNNSPIRPSAANDSERRLSGGEATIWEFPRVSLSGSDFTNRATTNQPLSQSRPQNHQFGKRNLIVPDSSFSDKDNLFQDSFTISHGASSDESHNLEDTTTTIDGREVNVSKWTFPSIEDLEDEGDGQ